MIISGVKRCHTGNSAVSQSNNSTFCATGNARVRRLEHVVMGVDDDVASNGRRAGEAVTRTGNPGSKDRVAKPGPRAEPAHPTTARTVTTSTKNGFTPFRFRASHMLRLIGGIRAAPGFRGDWGAGIRTAIGSNTTWRNHTLAQKHFTKC